MVWRLYRKRRWMLAALTMGTCFQASGCLAEAQLTVVRIGFSSVTLPWNQAISGLYGFASSFIANLIASAVTGL